jgi:hypothetical protein
VGCGRGSLVRLSQAGDRDARRNQAWDDLLTLVDRAWSWRDPESLGELEARVVHLGLVVEADWT